MGTQGLAEGNPSMGPASTPSAIFDSAESGDREASAGSLIPGSSSAESNTTGEVGPDDWTAGLTALTEMYEQIRAEDLAARAPEEESFLVWPDGSRCGWPDIRSWVLSEADDVCARCGAEATEVDHIWPKRWGGRSNVENLQALCGRCNKVKGVSVTMPRASNRQLLGTLNVAFCRFRDDLNWVCLKAMTEALTRTERGEMTHAEARVALDELVGWVDGVAEVTRSWSGQFLTADEEVRV